MDGAEVMSTGLAQPKTGTSLGLGSSDIPGPGWGKWRSGQEQAFQS
jgi:hypothetical protein